MSYQCLGILADRVPVGSRLREVWPRRRVPSRLRGTALSASTNWYLLSNQISEFKQDGVNPIYSKIIPGNFKSSKLFLQALHLKPVNSSTLSVSGQRASVYFARAGVDSGDGSGECSGLNSGAGCGSGDGHGPCSLSGTSSEIGAPLIFSLINELCLSLPFSY